MKSDVIQWTEDKRSGLPREDKYCVEPGTYCGLIMLFSTRNGEPLAMMNDGHLQHMRVGGGAGIGVKHLSREDSTTVGMLGSGGMARTYLQAFCSVRPITRVKVYSPSRENRELYAREMEQELQLEVIPVDSARGSGSGRRYCLVMHQQHGTDHRTRVAGAGHACYQPGAIRVV